MDMQQEQHDPKLAKKTLWLNQEEDRKVVGVDLLPRGSSSRQNQPNGAEGELEPAPTYGIAPVTAHGAGNSVYFDKLRGLWKCRHCNWDHKIGDPCMPSVQDPVGHLHIPMSTKPLNQGCLETKGTESINQTNEMKSEITKITSTDGDHHMVKIFEDKKDFGLSSALVKHLHEAKGSFKHFDNVTKAEVDFDIFEDIEEDLVALHVERVFYEQKTHELYCPNCKSCITKRVTLIRRRPKDPIPAPPAEQDDTGEQEKRVSAISCLSCFSLFIPIGNGCFKMLQFFGWGREPIIGNGDAQKPRDINWNGDTQNPQNTSPVAEKETPERTSCFSFISASKGKATAAQGDNGINDIERGVTKPTLPLGANVPSLSPTGTVPIGPGEVHECEILKSIVYGGLIESIASLGVVSSAAGADADTLNVLSLGVANLIGGLILIWHNLRDLKNDQPRVGGGSVVEEDRYQALLGRRQNFAMHATLAVLSFLVFGLVPPVVYGFSFRESDDKDLKLAAVAGASLICIFMLALGKGHVSRPHPTYFRSVSYYIGQGITASGISYVVGQLVKRLLEKLGLFESSSTVSLPFLDTGRASY